MKIRHLILLSCSLNLWACASLPGFSDSKGSDDRIVEPPVEPQVEQDPAELAALYLDQAAMSDGEARIPLLERACHFAAQALNTDFMGQALALYPELSLSTEQRAAYDTCQALRFALDEQPKEVLRIIAGSPKPEQPAVQADYWLAQSLAYQQLDDGEAATLMLVLRGSMLPATEELANRARIWELQRQGSRFLFADESERYDATTRGWIALGQIARRFWSDESGLQAAINQWIAQFPGHPASSDYLPQARQIAEATLRSAARHIALLLPLSDRLAGAASAVRDGFLAAHFANSAPGLEIRIYDTSTDAIASYEQALADGADLIVGPLDKQAVEAVVSRNADQLPILALNYRDAPGAGSTVLEYGLAPEDDARSVALRALADGHTHAIALVSDDDWGLRSLRAFADAFSEGGGVIVDQRQFHGGPRDYPAVITDLLRLDESQSRAQAMQRLLGEEIDSMPVRRQDAEMLYLAASPSQGRQLRPQFRFYHASDLPIYASGRIYEGQANAELDKDLNGIRFCSLPWLLNTSETWISRRQAIEQAWPNRVRRLERLYAMGNDAYLLASALRNANWSQLATIAGATGSLSLDGPRIVRTLPCARFEQGVPQLSARL